VTRKATVRLLAAAVRLRRVADDREPRGLELAHVRRHLDDALDGLWRAVGRGPTAVAVAFGAPMIDDGRQPHPLAIESAVREPRPPSRSRYEPATADPASTEPARSLPRPPVSPGVAQGALLVRLSVGRHRRNLDFAAAQARLVLLRDNDRMSRQRAERSRRLIRVVALLIVPGVLSYAVAFRSSWLSGVWDDAATRGGFLGSLTLGAAGSLWTWVVTRRAHGVHEAPRTSAESHSIRSLLASEQLALRLAAGVAPGDAWRVVSRVNHFPPGSAMPARAVEDALALVEALRLGARRRQVMPAQGRITAVVGPLVTCLLPAAVIIVLL
jgi:hypothetical protein